ncbi:MAG: response regulator, partial [Tannerellaceae bacterium]|nr:response regulator [Tannerellaceae bacterium]
MKDNRPPCIIRYIHSLSEREGRDSHPYLLLSYLSSCKLIFVLCFLSVLFAAGARELPHYKIRRVSPVGGLCMNGQRDVRQDKWGFIWVTTVSDLYRFDGYTFKRYTEKLTDVNAGSFDRIEIDKAGDVYVCTNQGILKYNYLSDCFDCILKASSSLIKEDVAGRLWAVTHTIGMLDEGNRQFIPVESEEGVIHQVSAICTDQRNVYIGTLAGQVYLLDRERMKFRCVFSKAGHNIVDIARIDRTLYVLAENNGLLALDLDDFSERKHYTFFYPGGDMRISARVLFIDKYGMVWISGQRGLYILDPATDRYTHYHYEKTNPYGMPSSSVWRVSEDNQGNLWFGTYSGGLCFVNLSERDCFKSFNALTDDLSFPVVSSFEEQGASLWIGTEGGGLNRYDRNAGTFTHYTYRQGQNSLSYDNIQALLMTKNNELWIGMSRGGLDCLDTETGQFTHYRATDPGKPLLNNHVARLIAEGDSGIWIKYMSERDNLTYLSLDERRFEHFFPDSSYVQGGIADIARGNGDTLWIAGTNCLLWMDVGTRRLSCVLPDSLLASELKNLTIRTLYADNVNGVIWLGDSGKRLLRYSPVDGQLSVYTDLSKYDVYTIFSINMDGNSYLWLGTDNGLFRYDPVSRQLQQFNKADGAQGRNYYYYSTFKTASGELLFGGNEGFTVIDPPGIMRNEYKPHVIISEFFLDNTPMTPTSERSPLKAPVFQTGALTLRHNQNNFAFEFSSSNYLNPDKNRFRYRLRGYDNRWIETDAMHRTASYAKVPRGTYTFEIMTANNDGEWGNQTSLQIAVLPAPWFSAWAIAGYVLFFISFIYFTVRHYTSQRNLKMQVYLEEQEMKQKEEYHQEQLKFFTNVSHDFRTPLSLIIAALEAVKAGNVSPNYLAILENNAQRLNHLVNELMDFRSLQNGKIKLRLQTGDWNRFVKDNCSDFFEYARHKNIRFSVDCDESLPAECCFDPKIMEKILLNLLHNAFKYTSGGDSITLSTLSDTDSFHSLLAHQRVVVPRKHKAKMFGLVVGDTGLGIPESAIGLVFERYYRANEYNDTQHKTGSGIGLALVKGLVQLHNGMIVIYSEAGKGTDVVLGFPSDASLYDESDLAADKEANTILSDSRYPMERQGSSTAQVDPPAEALNTGHKKTLLLVEDNNELRALLAGMLREYYEVKEAADATTALGLLEDENTDAVITDVMMPGTSGTELCRLIREDICTSHLPIIMLTAKTGAENQIEGLHSGADIYLEKPVHKDILLLNLANLFRQQQRIKEYYSKHFFADSNDSSVNKRDAEFMRRLTGVIDANLADTELDVMHIASTLAMSHRKLYGKVKALTGLSVVEFIRSYRLRRAARILTEENISINTVMEQVGIDNPSYFSRIF